MSFLEWSLVSVVLLGASAATAQEDVCQGISFQGSRVQTGLVLTPKAKATDACLAAIAETIRARPAVRGVTVAAYVEDAKRVKGGGLAIAKAAAGILTKGGVPAEVISLVVPRLESTEKPRIEVSVFGQRSTRPATFVRHLWGDAFVGEGEKKRPLTLQMLVPGSTLISTGAGVLELVLADQSVLRLDAETALRVELVEGDGALSPVVQLEAGSVEATRPTTVELVSGAQKVRTTGAIFRATAEGESLRIEVLSGSALLSNEAGEAPVGAGQGARIGKIQEAARALLPAVSGLRSQPGPPTVLSWAAAPHVSQYRVQWARDAAFLTQASQSTVTAPTLAPPPASGRWFWRVLPVDSAGYLGDPSKILSFEVGGSKP